MVKNSFYPNLKAHVTYTKNLGNNFKNVSHVVNYVSHSQILIKINFEKKNEKFRPTLTMDDHLPD